VPLRPTTHTVVVVSQYLPTPMRGLLKLICGGSGANLLLRSRDA
jgi:hypothetical protein